MNDIYLNQIYCVSIRTDANTYNYSNYSASLIYKEPKERQEALVHHFDERMAINHNCCGNTANRY